MNLFEKKITFISFEVLKRVVVYCLKSSNYKYLFGMLGFGISLLLHE